MSGGQVGLFAPLRVRRFRLLVPVELGISVGVWIIVLAAQWILTVGGESATVVATVQVAASLPFFLLGLPIGAVADVVGHRLLLVSASVALAGISAVAAILATLDVVGVAVLMSTVFVAGAGLATMAIVWQALLPHLVDRPLMAVVPALDGAVFNGARAVGPVIGGAILATFGTSATFVAVAVVFAVCAAIAAWQVPRDSGRGRAPDSWTQHIATATRFIRHSSWMRTLLLLMVAFGVPSSALWALLPIVANERLHATTFEFGLVSGAIGIGAVMGTLLLMPLRRRLSWNSFVALGAIAYAVVLAGMAVIPSVPGVSGLMVVAGAAWVAVQSTWMVAAHHVVPAWIRAQVLGILIVTGQAVQAAGAMTWGLVADWLGLVPALFISAVLMGAASATFLRVRIRGGDELVPEPAGSSDPEWDRVADSDMRGRRAGVETRYVVRPDRRAEFVRDMREVRLSRLRLGAVDCVVWEDMSDPGTFVELSTFHVWDDFLAQERDRLTIPEGRVRARLAGHLVEDSTRRFLMEPTGFGRIRAPRRRLRRQR